MNKNSFLFALLAAHSTFGRMNWPRFVAVAVLAPAVAVLFVLIVASQGDPDLPPYVPATPAERFCSTVAAVLVWPAVAVAKLVGPDGHAILFWSLLCSSGLFWALLVAPALSAAY